MALFYILTILLFVTTAIFYIIFFSLVYYWHEKKESYIFVPFIYTFEYFLIGFLVISIISILAEYGPKIFGLFV